MVDPRSKIPQDSWGGILDLGSWIRHIEIQYGFKISIWLSLNPRFLPKSPEESWIVQCVSKRPFDLKYVPLRSFVGESEEFNIREYFIFSI